MTQSARMVTPTTDGHDLVILVENYENNNETLNILSASTMAINLILRLHNPQK